MIIPIRCFSCGKPLAHKWQTFKEYLDNEWIPDDALNELEIRNICCRRMFLTHVDVIDKLIQFPDSEKDGINDTDD